MAAEKRSTAKRQQIAESNKMVFISVAAAAGVVGFSIVLAWFLIQQLAFNQKVLNEKLSTSNTIDSNIRNVSELSDNVRALDANSALEGLRAKQDDKAIQVILDSLPADGNSLALGSSLQKQLIGNIEGINLDSLVVYPVSGVENALPEAEVVGSPEIVNSSVPESAKAITFRAVVSSKDPNLFKQMLQQFERSIRVIEVDSLTFETSDAKYSMAIDAHAYYEPEHTVKLDEKEIKR